MLVHNLLKFSLVSISLKSTTNPLFSSEKIYKSMHRQNCFVLKPFVIVYRSNSELVKQLSQPESGASDLQFKRTYAQSWYGQFKSILWKMNLSYWRNPSYNLMRLIHTLISSLIFGALFWKQGQKM